MMVTSVVMLNDQGPWTSGLLDCFDDCGSCCCGCFCASCQSLINAQDVGEPTCLPWCAVLLCLPCYPCMGNRRGSLRAKYNIREEPCGDCCIHCWCNPVTKCALCQETREIKYQMGRMQAAMAQQGQQQQQPMMMMAPPPPPMMYAQPAPMMMMAPPPPMMYAQPQMMQQQQQQPMMYGQQQQQQMVYGQQQQQNGGWV